MRPETSSRPNKLGVVSRWTCVASFLIASLSASMCAAAKPNILFIYLDDFGWRDTGYMGSDFFETPHLDQLAAEGMVFDNAYSCAANCAPARACLMSGLYTPRHKVFNVGTRPRGNAKHRRLKHVPGVNTLDRKYVTWVELLKANGYQTAHLGKWHLSDDPLPYGFDVNVGGTHSGSPPKGYYPPHNAPGLKDAPENEYLTDRLNDEAIKFIRESRDRPWLLYLSHFAVHTPLDAKRELVEKYKQKPAGSLHKHVAMATMIQAVDDGVGKIRETLRSSGIEDKTIVIFYSDNGGYGGATDMHPLRGYKGTYYEGGIRVPFFVKWPGAVNPNTKSSVPITGVDLYPTICGMTDTSIPVGRLLDGIDLAPLLRGDTHALKDRAIYWHFPAYLQANGNWKSESRDPLFRSRPCSVVRKGQWKLLRFYEDKASELYNLVDDPSEQHNLSEKMPEQASKLNRELDTWLKATNAPIPSEPNPNFDAAAEQAAVAKRGTGK